MNHNFILKLVSHSKFCTQLSLQLFFALLLYKSNFILLFLESLLIRRVGINNMHTFL